MKSLSDRESNAAAGPAQTGEPEVAPESAPPMSASLLGRLFLVPAILVSMLVLGLMSVVLLFGWPGFGERPSVRTLLDQMESSDGGKLGGVALMPRDKDVWLAAQELSERLKNADKELKPEELGPTADRLIAIFQRRIAAESVTESESRLAEFTLLALTRLGTARAVETLTAALSAKPANVREAGLRGLVELKDDPAVRGALPGVVGLLDDPVPEVRVIAAVSLGLLATSSDADVIGALAGRLGSDQELEWNAALALGRLGSNRSKLTLLSMLDRGQWQKLRVRYTDQYGQQIDRPATEDRIAGRVETYMLAAIDAAALVDDTELRAAIAALKNDPSALVRQRATEALNTRPKPMAGQMGSAGS